VQLPRVTAIPHGLEFVAAPAADPQSSPHLPVIAFQGRLVTTKGVGVLFEAARILIAENRAFELLVIGDGPERASLERLSQNAPLAGHVRFAGRLLGSELDAALRHASVVAVPSLGGEVFGLVVAENMLRGLPVAAGDSRIAMHYAPRSFTAGAILTLLAFVGSLVAFLVLGDHARRTTS